MKEGGCDIKVESKFAITKKDQKRILVWCMEQDKKSAHMQQQSGLFKDDSHKEDLLRREIPNYGAVGGALTYHFTPTAIGTVFTVSHAVTKEALDLTDYDSW